MKILLDTNIIVDILAQRKPFFDSSFSLLNAIYDKNHTPCISASAVTDIVYILRKYISDKKKLLDTVKNFLKLVAILPTTQHTVSNAFLLNLDDYEDAVQLQVAMENKISKIITRNRKDFHSHIVAIQTPEDFLLEQIPCPARRQILKCTDFSL